MLEVELGSFPFLGSRFPHNQPQKGYPYCNVVTDFGLSRAWGFGILIGMPRPSLGYDIVSLLWVDGFSGFEVSFRIFRV